MSIFEEPLSRTRENYTRILIKYSSWTSTVITLSIGTPNLLSIMYPKIWNNPFYYLMMWIKYYCMNGKQGRPW